jgi:hypothetical protein
MHAGVHFTRLLKSLDPSLLKMLSADLHSASKNPDAMHDFLKGILYFCKDQMMLLWPIQMET